MLSIKFFPISKIRIISIFFFLVISTSFFSLASSVPELTLIQFTQEGNQYIIIVKSTKVAILEFFFKPQEAEQGAYQMIATLQYPNHGDLYKVYWNISNINDGNYTIMVRSNTGAILETNVIVNKAHWEISPIFIQYPGWNTANYIGNIEGTVTTIPYGGTLENYKEYFLFTRQGNVFTITVQEIPSAVSDLIFKQLYSNGQKYGTLYYLINDDILEVRIIFPSLANYSPYSQPPPSSPDPVQFPQPTPQPTSLPSQNSQELQQILNELNAIKNQNAQISQETNQIKTEMEQKNIEIEDLKRRIDEEEQKREKEKNNFFFYIIIILVGIVVIIYGLKSRNTKNSFNKMNRSQDTNFIHGKPFRIEEKGEKIPIEVIDKAREYDLDSIALWEAVKECRRKEPFLSVRSAINKVLNSGEEKECQE